MLSDLDANLHARGVQLCFAGLRDPGEDKLKRCGILARLGEETILPTLGADVRRDLNTWPVSWRDWKHRNL